MVQMRSDRWYSRSGQRRISSHRQTSLRTSRRLISLVLLLIMVLWVMKKSAEPEVFERVFQQLGVPLDGGSERSRPFISQANTASSNAANLLPSQGGQGNPQSSVVSEIPQLATNENEVLGDLGPSNSFFEGVWEALPWTAADLYRATELAFKPTTEIPSVSGDDQVDASSTATDIRWSTTDIQLAVEIALSESPREFYAWLDRRLLRQLTDGSPWRGSETGVFFRLLQKTRGGPETDAELLPITSYPTLKESLKQDRGVRWTRFRGTVERIKNIQVEKSHFGIKQYWTIWMRPSDGSAYPVVVYLTRLPEKVNAKPLEEIKGEIEVYGLPAKLVAYNAVGGVELAPALCGIASDYWVSDRSYALARENAARKPSDGLWAVGFSLCIASLAILWIWNRTRNLPPIETETAEPKKKDSKRLKFQLGKGKSSTGSALALIWAMGVVVAHTSSLQAWVVLKPQDAPTDERSASDTALSMVNTRLTTESLEEIRQYSTDESQQSKSLPDSLARVMFLMDQLGRPQMIQLSEHVSMAAAPWRVSTWTGWVKSCKMIPLNAKQKEWMDQSVVYRLDVQIDIPVVGDSTTRTEGVLYVRRAPSQWLNQAVLNQPFKAVLIDVSHRSNEPTSSSSASPAIDDAQTSMLSPATGIATEVQWTFGAEKSIDALLPELPMDWKRLLLYGSDLTWIDKAQQRQNANLSFEDRESFYSLLRIAKEVLQDQNGSTLGPATWSKPPETELLTKSQQNWIGKGIEIKGRIARITRVRIDSADSRKLAGSEFYYELDGFVRIEGKRISVAVPKIKDASDERVRTEELVYENEFPMTVVSLQLPDFLLSGAIDRDGVEHQSWEPKRWVDIRGFYFRNWSYHSEFVSGQGSRERQMAPLIVASELQPTEFDFPTITSPSQFLSWFVVVAILGLAFICGRFLLSDRASRKGKRKKLSPK